MHISLWYTQISCTCLYTFTRHPLSTPSCLPLASTLHVGSSLPLPPSSNVRLPTCLRKCTRYPHSPLPPSFLGERISVFPRNYRRLKSVSVLCCVIVLFDCRFLPHRYMYLSNCIPRPSWEQGQETWVCIYLSSSSLGVVYVVWGLSCREGFFFVVARVELGCDQPPEGAPRSVQNHTLRSSKVVALNQPRKIGSAAQYIPYSVKIILVWRYMVGEQGGSLQGHRDGVSHFPIPGKQHVCI